MTRFVRIFLLLVVFLYCFTEDFGLAEARSLQKREPNPRCWGGIIRCRYPNKSAAVGKRDDILGRKKNDDISPPQAYSGYGDAKYEEDKYFEQLKGTPNEVPDEQALNYRRALLLRNLLENKRNQ